MTKYLSILDTQRFGFNIAKVNNFETTPSEIIKELKSDGVKMIITKIDCEKLITIQELESLNFRIMDFQLTYKYDLKNYSVSDNQIKSDIIIREANLNDIDELVQIAAQSFNNYGHYFADKRLDLEKCQQIYPDWIRRSIEDKNVADVVFVAEQQNMIAGFLSFKIKQETDLFAAGVQGAVSEKFRNQSLFRLLALHGLVWGKSQNVKWVEHNVLFVNYPVNRSFIKLGFIPGNSFITMHCWLD